MLLTRHAATLLIVLRAYGLAASGEVPRPSATLAMTCTNTYSGATWQISIDLRHGTVDSNPARISDAEISWHDAKNGGNYRLNRSTGNLTAIVASSTGGYFLYHSCKLPP